MNATTHRSYSQVRQLRTCGESYRLERIEKVPSRPSCAAVAGKMFHTISEEIDKHLLGTPSVTRAELAELARVRLDTFGGEEIAGEEERTGFAVSDWKRYGRATEAKPRGEDMSWFLSVGIPSMIDAYVDWRFDHPEMVIAEIPGFGPAIEVPFNYYLDGQLIHGWIDRVFEPFIPVDLKSGQKPKTDEQLGLYGAALQAALGVEPTWGYYVYGLKTGVAKMTPPLNISHWSKAKLDRVYRTATLQIESGLFSPNPGPDCFHCSVSDHCEFIQALV